MTTEEELKALQDRYDSLSKEKERYDKAVELNNKVKDLEAFAKTTKPQGNDIGSHMQFLLVKHGLRATFYCFVLGMTIILVGIGTPYYLVKDIPYMLTFFNVAPTVLFVYGVYKVPFLNKLVKDFWRDDK